MTTNTHTLQIEEILELLPHRFPFLLVDRVLDFEEGRFLRAENDLLQNPARDPPVRTGNGAAEVLKSLQSAEYEC